MNSVIRKLGYGAIHIFTLGRGVTKKINGTAVKFPTNYFRYFPEDYEKENFSLINTVVNKDDVVIDIGAHIGLMAVVLGKRVGENGKVYSFEPTPYSFTVLKETIKLNKLEKTVSPVNMAVAATSGSIEFNANKEDVSNSIVSYGYNSGHKKITVTTTSIDDFVKQQQLSRLNFIKIDAEGVELDVLKGAKETLRQFDLKMILALHPLAVVAKGDTMEEIYDTVIEWGYKVLRNNKEMTRGSFCGTKKLFDVYLEK